jgi:hypothetical protein
MMKISIFEEAEKGINYETMNKEQLKTNYETNLLLQMVSIIMVNQVDTTKHLYNIKEQ